MRRRLNKALDTPDPRHMHDSQPTCSDYNKLGSAAASRTQLQAAELSGPDFMLCRPYYLEENLLRSNITEEEVGLV